MFKLCSCRAMGLVVRPTRPARNDGRNADVSVIAHGRGWFSLSSMSLDLITARPDVTPLELERSLLEGAAAVKDRHYKTLALARSGREVFVMSGDDFQELGREFGQGVDVVGMIRALPEYLVTVDGHQAFPTREGDELEVSVKELGDAKRFAEDWVSGEHLAAPVSP